MQVVLVGWTLTIYQIRTINFLFPCVAKNLAKGLALSEPPDMSRFVFPLSTPQQGMVIVAMLFSYLGTNGELAIWEKY